MASCLVAFTEKRRDAWKRHHVHDNILHDWTHFSFWVVNEAQGVEAVDSSRFVTVCTHETSASDECQLLTPLITPNWRTISCHAPVRIGETRSVSTPDIVYKTTRPGFSFEAALQQWNAAYCYRRSSVVCLCVCLSLWWLRSWAMHKWLNRSKGRLGGWLGRAQGTIN